ncbi:hypothetical protein GYMLUDRAFT_416002 [Collybiopsis luxurians FD-317 M1]|nr:hypothetical protein GYMLUDRAFT_416002 [Collybiopsis luxurians FD-317 M1]
MVFPPDLVMRVFKWILHDDRCKMVRMIENELSTQKLSRIPHIHPISLANTLALFVAPKMDVTDSEHPSTRPSTRISEQGQIRGSGYRG